MRIGLALRATLLAALASGPASAQVPTFADLEGSVIEASVTQLRTVRSEKGEGQQRAHHAFKITIGPAAAIQYSQTITIERLMKRDSDTRTHAAKATLGQPHRFMDGKAVWVFENGTLTLLRTMDQGGNVMKLIFTRGASGLSCTTSGGFAREDGVGSLESKRAHFGAKSVEFLSSKVVASSCRVSKKN